MAHRHRHPDRDDGLARRARLDTANGIIGRLDGLAFRAAASDPTTIRIDLQPEHQPQHR